MDGAGDQLFTGARLAAEQRGGVSASHLAHLLVDLPHDAALANHVGVFELRRDRTHGGRVGDGGVTPGALLAPVQCFADQARHHVQHAEALAEARGVAVPEVRAQHAHAPPAGGDRHRHQVPAHVRPAGYVGDFGERHRVMAQHGHDDGLARARNSAGGARRIASAKCIRIEAMRRLDD